MIENPAEKQAAGAGYNINSYVPTSLSYFKSIFAVPALVMLDLLAIGCSLTIAYFIRTYLLPAMLPEIFRPELLAATWHNLWWLPLVLLSCMTYEDLYQKRVPYWKEVEKILKACTFAVIIAVALLYLAKLTGEISRTLVIANWLTTIVLIPAFRFCGKCLLLKWRIWFRPVLILGAGKTGELVLKALAREKTMGYQVVGFLDDNTAINGLVNPVSQEVIPVLGMFANAPQIITAANVTEIIVAAPGLPAKDLVELTNQLQPLVNNVMLVPDLFGLSINGIEVEYFFEEQALLLNVKNKLKSVLNRAVKRAFDLILGTASLILCLPLIPLIILAVRINSKGPAIYFQERIGQQGEPFMCCKFRTMYQNGDEILAEYLHNHEDARKEWEIYNKLRNYDPRVTKVGAVLRRFSIDELPQLLNVIRGHMSLVGPRPYLPREKDQMSSWVHDILVAKPGITGLWQVSGRSEIDFTGRLRLDAWYVRNWSLWLDMIMLVKTIRVVLARKGAY